MVEPIRVLYIEDDPGTAELVRNHLENFDCVVTLVLDGESGLTQCRSSKFDIVLIDHSLSRMSGLEVIRELHQINKFPPAMMMVTGTGNESVAVEALKSGADDYIVKDVMGGFLDLLVEVIHKVLEKWELRRDHQRMVEEQTQHIEDLKTFSYAVAHDLKQPLSVLATSLGLAERYIQREEQNRALEKLTLSQETISKINVTLEGLILLANIRGTTTVDFKPIQMSQLVQRVCQQLDDMIQRYQAQITFPEEMPMALGYAPWIEEIWINYLTNALKYGGTPPQIEIGALSKGDGTSFYWVKDNGKGFTGEEQQKLFIPFSRLNDQKGEGHGLGLSIVAMIVRKLGGEIVVNSVPDVGSTFGFILRTADEK